MSGRWRRMFRRRCDRCRKRPMPTRLLMSCCPGNHAEWVWFLLRRGNWRGALLELRAGLS